MVTRSNFGATIHPSENKPVGDSGDESRQDAGRAPRLWLKLLQALIQTATESRQRKADLQDSVRVQQKVGSGNE